MEKRLMKRIMRIVVTMAVALAIGLTVGVDRSQPSTWANAAELAQASPESAQAVMRSTADPSEVLGEATFTETIDGLKVDVSLSNVPAGYHGFHVHEFGNCDDAGAAAGGHFNPEGVKHGYLPKDGFENAHAGDLGNILIYSDGTGELTETIEGLPLTEGNRAIVDHAVILHAERDDFGQPTGNAGGRIGCGLIGAQ